MNITPEMIEALKVLRNTVRDCPPSPLRSAINLLDNAGVFAAIDEATGYGDPEPTPVPGLDPAEWGDMAYGSPAERGTPELGSFF